MINRAGGKTLRVVLPSGVPRGIAELITLERAELETVTGCRVVDDATADLSLRWTVDPSATAVSMRADADGFHAVVPSAAGVIESLGLLHGLDSRADALPSPDRWTAIERLDAALRASFPGAHLRPIDWDGLRTRHEPDVLAADDPLPAFQRWLAELDDVHTAARPTTSTIASPYVIRVADGAARMLRVPPDTSAFRAGVRPGWTLTVPEPTTWLSRTGAPAHVRPLLAGRRLASAPVGTDRVFVAVSPEGEHREWTEHFAAPRPSADWTRVSDSVGVLMLSGWTADTVDQIDSALHELRGCAGLIIDLRGNTGGNVVAAINAQKRFLRERTHVATIRYTDGRGRLGPRHPLIAEPSDATRWRGGLVVLTDPLTASASEDFLLGLQGLSHVRVVGTQTAGGSGRPLTRHLIPGVDATISTALTYDRSGRCIEGRGIPTDITVDPFDDAATISAAISALE